MPPENILAAAQAIRLLILDVDGVLSDGRITYSDQGEELKSFHVRDGSAIKFWRESGRSLAIISGRRSEAVVRRARELGIERLEQGIPEKIVALRRIIDECGIPPREIAVMGDDLPDLPLFQACGVGIAVADACPELLQHASYITHQPGGNGAVREAIEWLMKAQGTWEDVVRRHLLPT